MGVFGVLALLLTGCGGDSDEDSDDDRQASCPVRACGGDVVGTWNVDSFCLAFAEPPAPSDEPECDDFLRDTSVDAAGTLTFTADGTATSNLTTQFRIDIALTDTCAQALGGNVTQEVCDELEATYATDPEYASADCSFSPGACWCTIVSLPSNSGETSAYTLDGNQIIIGDSEPSNYCVEGDSLTIGVVASDGSYSIEATRAL